LYPLGVTAQPSCASNRQDEDTDDTDEHRFKRFSICVDLCESVSDNLAPFAKNPAPQGFQVVPELGKPISAAMITRAAGKSSAVAALRYSKVAFPAVSW
jgi:hypothetical protein